MGGETKNQLMIGFVMLGVLILGGVLGRESNISNISQSNNNIVLDQSLKNFKVDINKADPYKITELKGIDLETAKKIVDNRPYKRTYELLDKEILDLLQYENNKDLLIAGD